MTMLYNFKLCEEQTLFLCNHFFEYLRKKILDASISTDYK